MGCCCSDMAVKEDDDTATHAGGGDARPKSATSHVAAATVIRPVTPPNRDDDDQEEDHSPRRRVLVLSVVDPGMTTVVAGTPRGCTTTLGNACDPHRSIRRPADRPSSSSPETPRANDEIFVDVPASATPMSPPCSTNTRVLLTELRSQAASSMSSVSTMLNEPYNPVGSTTCFSSPTTPQAVPTLVIVGESPHRTVSPRPPTSSAQQSGAAGGPHEVDFSNPHGGLLSGVPLFSPLTAAGRSPSTGGAREGFEPLHEMPSSSCSHMEMFDGLALR